MMPVCNEEAYSQFDMYPRYEVPVAAQKAVNRHSGGVNNRPLVSKTDESCGIFRANDSLKK